MKVLDKGHTYLLDNVGNTVQELKFIKKEKSSDSDTLLTVQDGTTDEEVIKVLIDRITELNNNFRCRENSLAITKLEEALMWLEKRTKDRIARGVEGKNIK